VTVSGLVRDIETFDTKPDADGVVNKASRVTILTEPAGGFMEIYLGPEDQAAVPAKNTPVSWLVEVRAWNRTYGEGENARKFADLSVRFVEDCSAGAIEPDELPPLLSRIPDPERLTG
jgi:hypothetical protein